MIALSSLLPEVNAAQKPSTAGEPAERCPKCGGRMLIIERFQGTCRPRKNAIGAKRVRYVMIRAKTVSSASMAGLSRGSRAGNAAACLKAENRACFANPSQSLRRQSARPCLNRVLSAPLRPAICTQEPLHA